MSLYGYKKKGKPALWTTVPDAAAKLAKESAAKQAKKEIAKLWRKKKVYQGGYAAGSLVNQLPKFKPRIRRVSKKRQVTGKVYREKAQAFIAAAIARGETCPVVAKIPELRNGVKYGHPVCNRLNEIHHTRGRAGSLLLDERFWLPLSKQGHRWVHENMNEARKHGWLCELGKWNVPEAATGAV